MKKTIYILLFVFSTVVTNAQITNTQHPETIISNHDGITQKEAPSNSYIKDIFQDFDKYIGTWTWTNGSDIVKYKITKITKYYYYEYDVYKDILVCDYSYTTNNNSITVVNTITNPTTTLWLGHPMYSSGEFENKVNFTFYDVLLQKGWASAIFEISPNNINEMNVKLLNPNGTFGRLDSDPEYNFNFTLPIELTLIKE